MFLFYLLLHKMLFGKMFWKKKTKKKLKKKERGKPSLSAWRPSQRLAFPRSARLRKPPKPSNRPQCASPPSLGHWQPGPLLLLWLPCGTRQSASSLTFLLLPRQDARWEVSSPIQTRILRFPCRFRGIKPLYMLQTSPALRFSHRAAEIEPWPPSSSRS